jgi:hypothetical protein
MHSAIYYRAKAAIARELAARVTDEAVSEILRQTAEDYEDMARDLDDRAIEKAELRPTGRRVKNPA